MIKYKRSLKSCLSTSEKAEVFEWDAQHFVMTVKVIYLSGLQIKRDDKRKQNEKKFQTLLLSHSMQ